MGKTEANQSFCDRCFAGERPKLPNTEPQFFLCTQQACQGRKQIFCAGCAVGHYRTVHPEKWLEWITPVQKELNQEALLRSEPEAKACANETVLMRGAENEC